jgi:hypothetical protein
MTDAMREETHRTIIRADAGPGPASRPCRRAVLPGTSESVEIATELFELRAVDAHRVRTG